MTMDFLRILGVFQNFGGFHGDFMGSSRIQKDSQEFRRILQKETQQIFQETKKLNKPKNLKNPESPKESQETRGGHRKMIIYVKNVGSIKVPSSKHF